MSVTKRTLEDRLFPPFTFDNGWSLSAQADKAGYACAPRERLEHLEDYDSLECVIYGPDEDPIDISGLKISSAIRDKFSPSCDGGVFVGAFLTLAEVSELRSAINEIEISDNTPDI